MTGLEQPEGEECAGGAALPVEDAKAAAPCHPSDLGPVIDGLMSAATAAIQSQAKTVAMLNAATRMMAEAARLKLLAPHAPAQGRPRGRLSGAVDEEDLDAWAARWGPPS